MVFLRSIAVLMLGFASRLSGADTSINEFQSFKNHLDWISKITSYQYTVNAFSKSTPQNRFIVTYRENGPQYYYDALNQSPDPARTQVYKGDTESWDGTMGMWLEKKSSILYVDKKKYPFKIVWSQLLGLFFPFRFTLAHNFHDIVETPQLKDVTEAFSNFAIQPKSTLTDETKNNKPFACLTTNGGLDNLANEQISIKTYFSKNDNYYPMILEMYDKNNKLRAVYTVDELAYYKLEKENISIPYPVKTHIIYYNTATGAEMNIGVNEYSNVVFNSEQITNFQIDPSQARMILDQRVNKVIQVPQ